MDYPQKIKLIAITDRHSELVNAFTGELRPAKKNGELIYWSDTVALVYNENKALINVSHLTENEKQKLQFIMGKLGYKEPDILVFHEQIYLNNRKNTRKAGCPDLIIEVWSDMNDEAHRQEKFQIYASSPVTEHWYMEQESDIIKCYIGERRLPDQHLKNLLTTQNGLQFDLRDVQTYDDESWNEFLEYGYKG